MSNPIRRAVRCAVALVGALFLSASLSASLSACSSDNGGACTEIGCTDQLTIRPLTASGELIRYVRGELIIDGKSVPIECLPTSPQSDSIVSCTVDGVVIQTKSTDVVVKSLVSGDYVATEGAISPVYAAVRPNGPGCAPVCQQAVLDLQLGGGLVDATGPDGGAAGDQ